MRYSVKYKQEPKTIEFFPLEPKWYRVLPGRNFASIKSTYLLTITSVSDLRKAEGFMRPILESLGFQEECFIVFRIIDLAAQRSEHNLYQVGEIWLSYFGSFLLLKPFRIDPMLAP